MSRAAQEVERQVREMRSRSGRVQDMSRDGATITNVKGDGVNMATTTRTETTKRPRRGAVVKRTRVRGARRAPRAVADQAATAKDPTAGVRSKPKNQVLFLNRAGALALVARLLKAASDLTPEEQFESDRLTARLRARGY